MLPTYRRAHRSGPGTSVRAVQAVSSASVAWFLIASGVVLFLLTLGLAFTIYGIVAAIMGVISVAAGVWLLARRTSNQATRQ